MAVHSAPIPSYNNGSNDLNPKVLCCIPGIKTYEQDTISVPNELG
jgi:hypothetical protein